MEHNQCNIAPRLITNEPYVSNFMTILDFSPVAEKTGLYREEILASWGHALVAAAVLERYKWQ